MMKVVKNIIDSKILGRDFLDIVEFSMDEDFNKLEEKYIEENNPLYVSVKIPIENLSNIQFMETHGFSFIEIQIRETLRLNKSFDHIIFTPYKIEPVKSESDLDSVISIASETFNHDRYTLDNMLPDYFSGNRYKLLVEQSFNKADEYLYKFVNDSTGEILGFKTHRIVSENEATMLLGGIKETYKRSPLPGISSYLELNELFNKGITKITTHISGSNYGVLNLELKKFGYKVVQLFVVLRKIYS